jgi:hypothetical protein
MPKTYSELTPSEREKAREKSLEDLLCAICEGALRFNDKMNGDGLQARIDAAFAKAEKMQTPWFAHEYVLDTCRDDLERMAICDAEDALYALPGEIIIHGVAE